MTKRYKMNPLQRTLLLYASLSPEHRATFDRFTSAIKIYDKLLSRLPEHAEITKPKKPSKKRRA